jgi:hypothetical protein
VQTRVSKVINILHILESINYSIIQATQIDSCLFLAVCNFQVNATVVGNHGAPNTIQFNDANTTISSDNDFTFVTVLSPSLSHSQSPNNLLQQQTIADGYLGNVAFSYPLKQGDIASFQLVYLSFNCLLFLI